MYTREEKRKQQEVLRKEWEEQLPYACWLAGIEGLGNKTRYELAETAGSPKAVYEMGKKQRNSLLTEKKAAILEQYQKERNPAEQYEQFLERGLRFVPAGHPDFPQRLIHIPNPPYGLFVRGGLPKEEQKAVALIGARQCSEYGRQMAVQCTEKLAEYGIAVISGMARGIDGIAHQTALKTGGDTYAVLGCGADVCYPPEHRQLYEELRLRGGIISEYFPGTQPKAGLFPMRNRIISGLSDAVLIIEARVKSGTLITADLALELGKDVYAVPGRMADPLSQGCNRLIGQGAGILLSVEEMLSETGLAQRSTKGTENSDTKENERQHKTDKIHQTDGYSTSGVLNALDYYPKSTQQLQLETGKEYRQLVLELSGLCMEQQVQQVSPNYYIRK